MSLLLRDDIVTPPLSLIAITPEMLLSEKNGDGRLSELIQCVIPANWPLTDLEPHVFDFLLTQFAEHPEQLGWPRYISFVPPDGRTLISTLGAFTKAGRLTECEIGYSILAPYEEGRGFATEGARALIDYLRGNMRLSSVIAHTFPYTNEASHSAIHQFRRVVKACLDCRGEVQTGPPFLQYRGGTPPDRRVGRRRERNHCPPVSSPQCTDSVHIGVASRNDTRHGSVTDHGRFRPAKSTLRLRPPHSFGTVSCGQ